jgi:glycine/D-amino acid oxidase-like deaminating enzyme
VQLHHPAIALAVETDPHSSLSGIRIRNTETNTERAIVCARIVIAAGAWSPHVFSTLFPTSTTRLPISSLAGYSLVVRTTRWRREFEDGGCHAVFASGEDGGWAPELFSRLGGEIYVAGVNDAGLALPTLPTQARVDGMAVEKLKRTAARLLGAEGDGDGEDLEVVRTAVCFRPVTRRGTPILARMPEERLGGVRTRGGAEGGVWVAAGHGPWGISLSLGSGKVMAEMIQGRPTSVDIRGLGL